MKKPIDFISFLTGLLSHGDSLHYKDRYGAVVRVVVQPLAKLEKLNADPGNIAKLKECGVRNAVVIGSDEHGVPVLLDCDSLKTYLLDPTTSGSEYLKNVIVIIHD